MTTPASKRKGLGLTAELTATLQKFTVPKLKTGTSMTADELPSAAPTAGVTQCWADTAATTAYAEVAANAVLEGAMRAPAKPSAMASDSVQAAEPTDRRLVLLQGRVCTPEQPAASSEVTTLLPSAVLRVLTDLPADNLPSTNQNMTSVGGSDKSSASQKTHQSPRQAPSRGSEEVAHRLDPGGGAAPADITQQPLRCTVTQPPTWELSTGGTSPTTDADQVCALPTAHAPPDYLAECILQRSKASEQTHEVRLTGITGWC